MVLSAFVRPVRVCVRISINAIVGHLILVGIEWGVMSRTVEFGLSGTVLILGIG